VRPAAAAVKGVRFGRDSFATIAAQALAMSRALHPNEQQENMPRELKELMTGIVMDQNNISYRRRPRLGDEDYFEDSPDLESIAAEMMRKLEDKEDPDYYDIRDHILPFSYSSYSAAFEEEEDERPCPTLESIVASASASTKHPHDYDAPQKEDEGYHCLSAGDDPIVVSNDLGFYSSDMIDMDQIRLTRDSNYSLKLSSSFAANVDDLATQKRLSAHQHMLYVEQDHTKCIHISRIDSKNGRTTCHSEQFLNPKYVKVSDDVPVIMLIDVDPGDSSSDEGDRAAPVNRVPIAVPIINNWEKVFQIAASSSSSAASTRKDKQAVAASKSARSHGDSFGTVSWQERQRVAKDCNRIRSARTPREINSLKQQLCIPVCRPKHFVSSSGQRDLDALSDISSPSVQSDVDEQEEDDGASPATPTRLEIATHQHQQRPPVSAKVHAPPPTATRPTQRSFQHVAKRVRIPPTTGT